MEFLLVFASMAVTAVLCAVVIPGRWGGEAAAPMIGGLAAACLTYHALLGRVRRRRFVEISRHYLGEGRCASCGYTLHSLGHETDGCAVCPECGAAWRAERLGAAPEPPLGVHR